MNCGRLDFIYRLAAIQRRHPDNENNERRTVSKDDILPGEDECTALGLQILAQIDCLLSIVNDIPTVEDARRQLESGDVFVADARLNLSYAAKFGACSAHVGNEVEVASEEENEDDLADNLNDHSTTVHERDDQQVYVDLPVGADLNKKETVKGPMKTPLLEDCGVFSGGDGAPSHTFYELEAEDPTSCNNIQNFPGGFHQLLNFLQKPGGRCADAHLRMFLDPFRDTEKKQDWFLVPGDPNQTLAELPEMTMPHCVMAMRSLAAIQGIASPSLSAVNAHDFMLERAKKHDICMAILQWLHFVEVGNTLRDSERENDPSLHRVGAKLAMLLHVKTHAPKYVRMGVSFWIWWRCSSDADEALCDNFFFTKKTANGSCVWVDRFVEWFNKDAREYLGKCAKPDQELLVTRTAMLIKDGKRWKTANARRSGTGGNDEELLDETLAVSPVSCHQLVPLQRWNTWGDGSPLVGKKENSLEEPTCFTDPTGKNHLNVDLLFDASAAEETLKDYFEVDHLLHEANRLKRTEMETEGGVSLRATPVRAADIENERKAETIRQTSTDAEELTSCCKMACIEDRLVLLRSRHSCLEELGLPSRKDLKPQFAKALAAHHKAITCRNKRFKKQTEQSIPRWSDPSFGFAEENKKATELQHPFYALTAKARDTFSNNKCTVVCLAAPNVSQENETTPTTPTRSTTASTADAPSPLAAGLELLGLDD